jgi:hypothetical protein
LSILLNAVRSFSFLKNRKNQENKVIIMVFKKIEPTKDETGLAWIVDGDLCRRVSLDFDLAGPFPEDGEYLVPCNLFPDVAYKVIDKWEEGGKKAVEIKRKEKIRDLCLQLYEEGFYSDTLITACSIENHYGG